MSEDLEEILLHDMGEHEAVVKLRPPGNEASMERDFPERANQCADKQHLQKPHAHIGWHFEGSQFEKTELESKSLWGEQLVYAKLGAMSIPGYIGEQVSKESVDDVRRAICRREMAESDLEFI